ncbi:MAG: YciI family protein [Acidobacteriota bacterium]
MNIKVFAFVAAAIAVFSINLAAQKVEVAAPPMYDAELAKKLGADDRGMKIYVLCILKTGANDAKIKGKERDDIFAGHFANINRLANEGKLAVAGPFENNDKAYRGLYIFNVATLAEAEKLVVLDPAVKAGVFVPDLTLWYGTAALMTVSDTHKMLIKSK